MKHPLLRNACEKRSRGLRDHSKTSNSFVDQGLIMKTSGETDNQSGAEHEVTTATTSSVRVRSTAFDMPLTFPLSTRCVGNSSLDLIDLITRRYRGAT